ncbi:hypothetical protein BDY24DRAFT_384798 [Mrakia frigida]|uniref:DUF6534 domain-containing protein n=1 Tax=Mrakia frigida TaxID=29902 RepID=UPI003FCC0943
MNALESIARRAPTLSGDLPQSPATLLKNMLVGVLLDSILMGVVTVQCVAYWRDFPNHSRAIRWTVLVLLLFNIWQTSTNQIGIIEIMERTENYEWLRWAGTASVVFIGHFSGIFLMMIPHILLARKALDFARSLEFWTRRWRIVFAWVLGFGIAAAALSGTGAVVALWVQAKQWSGGDIPEGILDWYAIMLSVNLCTSAFTDLLLAGTLTWELRKSSGGEIGFGGTNKMLDSLTTILIANGVGLATLQLTICGIYLSGTNYTLGVVGLFILHKIYTITALTSICRPLEMQRAANQNPVRAAEFSSGEEGTSTQDSTLFERIVGRVRKKGNDDLEKGSKATTSSSSSSPPLAIPTLGKHDVVEPSTSPLVRPPNLPRTTETYGLDMQYIVSEMETEGVVAFSEEREKELSRVGSGGSTKKRSD